MAVSAILPAMNGEKVVHPFFAKPNGQSNSCESTSGDEIKVAGGVEQVDGVQDESVKTKGGVKARKSRISKGTDGKTQKTLQQIVNPSSNGPQEQSEDERREIPNSCSDDLIQTSSPRKKRRRVSRTESVEVGQQEDDTIVVNGEAGSLHSNPRRQSSPVVIIPRSSPLPTEIPQSHSEAITTPPKKMLKLNASGKFSSPISKKLEEDETPAEAPRRRGRPRKSKEVVEKKQLVVTMHYDHEGDFGQRIERVLSGQERIATETKAAKPKKQRTPRKPKPSKPMHPFFLEKPKDELVPPKQESPRKFSAVTPGKLRRQAMSDRSPATQSNRPVQEYAVGSGLLKDRLMFKHPGAKEPAWPSRESFHVRALPEHALSLHSLPSEPPFVKRKRKAAKVPLPFEESLLRHVSSHLAPEQDGELRPDGFREPHPALTLPDQLLISGEEIAERIAAELVAPLIQVDDDHTRSSSSQSTVHSALRKLYGSLPKTLSAFDEGRGEPSSWTQKYQPSCASDLLQPSREINVLKDWLASITVTAVDSGSRPEPKSILKQEAKLRKKKRRRKDDDMDDFLVDSDDDVRDMDVLTDPEEVPGPFVNGHKVAKSVVQIAGDGVKFNNAVLLSGPSGCGKTAAAFAVAKELNFKVFEISPCEKRSGKDVLEKVGDMTENHLVKHHDIDTGNTSSTEEPSRLEEAFQRDLASGKQGKVNAFFKPQTKAKSGSPKKHASKPKVEFLRVVQQAAKKQAKEQQQSLILLEEVDILFKDDKDFWNAILKLVATSKRPFIMTCNDEDLIPLQAMSLHAILRFSPPPIDLATDYLLLMAAAEGHLLKREAVASFYQTEGHDLRAAIAELDFWCQIGVGDPKSGLSWMYQRYPPGSDFDDQGRKLRVVSDNTYRPGMGLHSSSLGHDTKLHWAQYDLNIATETLLGWDDLLVTTPRPACTLNRYGLFADSLSAMDQYSNTSRIVGLDKTQPPMPDKARLQYIEGLQLLQTDEVPIYSNLVAELGVSSMLAALRAAEVTSLEDVLAKLQSSSLSSLQNDYSKPIGRRDFACFDAISTPVESALSTAPGLAQSVFDGPLKAITTDVAPYVRSIVHYDQALSEQRERLSNLINDTRTAKRARKTRAAWSALEGSQRSSTRRERWFAKSLDDDAVLATGGKTWPKQELESLETSLRDGTEPPASSASST